MSPSPNLVTSCAGWQPSKGAAWPWCGGCGVRADLHRGDVPVAAAVARIVNRAHVAAGDPITA